MKAPAATGPGLHLDIDLAFVAEHHASAGSPLAGRITANGSEITVALEGHDAIASVERPTLAGLRTVGAALSRQGLTVTVTDGRGTVIRLGALGTGPVRRALGGDRILAIGIGRALSALHGRRRGTETTAILGMPPGTLWPLIPGLTKAPRPRPTRTHSTPGSGRPRLYFVVGADSWDGRPPREFDLGERTVIGSGPDADLQLDGLPPVAAIIRRDSSDEYRLESETAGGGSALLDATGRGRSGRVLRTGARIELGPWRLAYFREEYADHGRPYGGRVGGEFAHQKPQAPRPGA